MFFKLLAGASTLVVGATLSLLSVASPAAAATVNPLDPAHGFTVLSQGNATMSAGSETEGSWAVGGDLTIASQYNLLANHDGTALPTFAGTGVQLLTGGKVVFGNGGETLDLNAGALRSADTAGYTVSGSRYSTQADTSAFARMFTAEPLTAITSTLYADTFGSAFATLAANAVGIHDLDASNATVLSLIEPTNENSVSMADKGLQLVNGTINVLHVTAAQLSAFQGIKFLGGVLPSASTPLYIDVTDAGAVDVTIPKVGDADPRFVLYNFAGATSAAVQGQDLINGAILAPTAAVQLTHATYQGQIVAKSFTTSSGQEIHHELFGGTIPPTTPTPPTTPKDASAAVSTTSATCAAPETLQLLTPTFATWGTPTMTSGPGSYSVVATAASGHLFADGSSTHTFTGNLGGISTTGCGPATVTLTVAPSYTPATCGSDGTLVLPTQQHIVWSGGTNGAGAGTYTITAQVDDATKYVLDAASTTWTVIVPARGVNPDGSGMNCAADCLTPSAVSYTYSPATNSGVITVTPTKYAHTLCNGFWVTATAWKYTTTGLWPQALDGYKEANGGTEITEAGTYTYGIPVSCGQGDIYASSGSPVPTPTATLGGTVHYNEHFLQQMGFSGPKPTWVQRPTGTCNVLDRDVVDPTVTSVGACGIPGSITWTDQPGKVAYALTKGNGISGANEVTATTTSPWVFDDNTTTHVYAVDLGQPTDDDCIPTLADFDIEWSSTAATCRTSGSAPTGTITVGPADFFPVVAYFIDGQRVTSPTTVVAAGTHTLTAASIDPTGSVDNPGPHTIDIASSGEICPSELKTLALTGSDSTPWGLGALAALALGFVLLALRKLRHRGRHTS